uniref:Uncharacterized protein n=1 Tax=Salix viminalis TaxID=40686 RepID=A0A6N2NLM6_SALVM
MDGVLRFDIRWYLHEISLKQELDILYEDLVETNDMTKAWLKVEPKDGHYHVILEITPDISI